MMMKNMVRVQRKGRLLTVSTVTAPVRPEKIVVYIQQVRCRGRWFNAAYVRVKKQFVSLLKRGDSQRRLLWLIGPDVGADGQFMAGSGISRF